MANPQRENGYTQIANEILEHLCRPGMNGSELRVVLFVLRKTYGFQKIADKISITQFQEATQMGRSQAVETITSLVVKRVLVKEESLYRFNKNWEEWVVSKRKDKRGRSQPEYQKFCYICKFSQALHKHYMVPRSQKGLDIFANKIPLCPNCHALAHNGKISMEMLLEKKKEYDGILLTTSELTSSQKPTIASSQKGYKTSSQKGTHKRKKETITKETSDKVLSQEALELNKQIPLLIDSFILLNPACKAFYKNTTQREACENLITTYTFDRVKTIVEKTLPKTNTMPFFPRASTPVQLWQKWTDLEAAVVRYRQEKLKKQPNVIFS